MLAYRTNPPDLATVVQIIIAVASFAQLGVTIIGFFITVVGVYQAKAAANRAVDAAMQGLVDAVRRRLPAHIEDGLLADTQGRANGWRRPAVRRLGQDLRPANLARRSIAAMDNFRQFLSFVLAEVDRIFVHPPSITDHLRFALTDY